LNCFREVFFKFAWAKETFEWNLGLCKKKLCKKMQSQPRDWVLGHKSSAFSSSRTPRALGSAVWKTPTAEWAKSCHSGRVGCSFWKLFLTLRSYLKQWGKATTFLFFFSLMKKEDLNFFTFFFFLYWVLNPGPYTC
jgi:hypothetical protein